MLAHRPLPNDCGGLPFVSVSCGSMLRLFALESSADVRQTFHETKAGLQNSYRSDVIGQH